MPNESIESQELGPNLVILLDEYKFKIHDINEPDGFAEYKGRMEISYDGEFLGIDTWEIPADKEFDENSVCQQVTLVGANQANLLVGAILALMEAYGEPNVFNDADIQKEYLQMAKEASDAYAQKATSESDD